MPNPRIPRLYGLMKLHKVDMPIRPVISTIASPTYYLAIFLQDWFKATSQFTPKHAVLGSRDLVNKLQMEQRKDGRLISFDVSGLFPNIPIEPTLEYARQLLRAVNVHTDLIDDFMKLLKVCLENNLCLFNGEIFKFPENVGVPIGSPLGSLMGDLFMDRLENEVLTVDNPLTVDVLYWFRYVDDILCLWGGGHRCGTQQVLVGHKRSV